METVLLETMYNAEKTEHEQEIIIDENVVKNNVKPSLVINKTKQEHKVADKLGAQHATRPHRHASVDHKQPVKKALSDK